ncbi:spore germination protein [Cytobacillus dafuensis]|uniref:Spore germination protein n=1 Tax=Cytobacillus dafuensis TaxID=1742359 RepID=A0A5B8YZN9_CYTDA|nr:spore germination protein [Cytobacillus dafuensis]QED46192.1 spore germination protein [Cytobacillus dafuensis]
MPSVINILNLKVNGTTQNGNIDIGPTVHNSHTANSKFFGSNNSFGDFSPTCSFLNTGTIDPDVSDQDQIANPSFPISNLL